LISSKPGNAEPTGGCGGWFWDQSASAAKAEVLSTWLVPLANCLLGTPKVCELGRVCTTGGASRTICSCSRCRSLPLASSRLRLDLDFMMRLLPISGTSYSVTWIARPYRERLRTFPVQDFRAFDPCLSQSRSTMNRGCPVELVLGSAIAEIDTASLDSFEGILILYIMPSLKGNCGMA